MNDKFYRDGDKPHKVEYSRDGNAETWIWYDENDREIKKETVDNKITEALTKVCRD